MKPLIYLASRSPRRRELLHQIGVSHRQLDVDIDESRQGTEGPRDYVLRLAEEKARAAVASLGQLPELPVLAADTVVTVEDELLCKPAGREEALAMLGRLSGRTHQVYTGVALMSQRVSLRLSRSEVSFIEISPERAAAYWSSGEPADKAGAYGIQGLGAVFIRELKGSYSGVMGLPLYETAELLRERGIMIPCMAS
jgi:septum formation protein